MRFCIPNIGAMIRLTEDWTIADVNDGKCGFYALCEFKDCKQTRTTGGNHPYEYESIEIEGSFTFLTGTIFKIDAIEMYSQKVKENRPWQSDGMKLTVVEAPMGYLVDDHIILTKTGKVSKRKKNRPQVSIAIPHEYFNAMEFEFTI